MPLYEYRCDACGNQFEKIVKFSDPPLEICPSCGGRVEKLFSSPAIQFKGTGWYITDYAKKSSPDSSGSSKSSGSPGKDAPSGSGDSSSGSSDSSSSGASTSTPSPTTKE